MPLPTVIEWTGDAASGHLRLLDQTRLPAVTTHLDCTTVQHVWDAIKRLSVRGAPAIGVAAAYGAVLGAQRGPGAFAAACDHLATSRPTAVNLFWALDRMRRHAAAQGHDPATLLAEARAIHDEDRAMCHAIGEHGLRFLQSLSSTGDLPRGILTHCNAGALATGGIGTATAPLYLAHQRGLAPVVFADETRPLLQGARLTAWELGLAGVDVTLICDGMAAQVMRERRVQAVIVGADRIAANGDAANKIGTYSAAVNAQHHGIPFLVAAPSSTFDLSLPTGDQIPIEQRDPTEVTPHATGKVYNPAFDVTPATLIHAIVTERGVIHPVTEANVRAMVG